MPLSASHCLALRSAVWLFIQLFSKNQIKAGKSDCGSLVLWQFDGGLWRVGCPSSVSENIV